MAKIETVAVIGTGVIGAGWATRCLAAGLDVIAADPAPDAEGKMRDAINNAWPSVRKLSLGPGQEPGQLAFAASMQEAVSKADFVQENAPEREDLKQALYADMDAAAERHVILASSTSGFMPSRLQSQCTRHPERVLVGHPFNPVYLLPLVEVVPGEATSADAVDTACAFYEDIGMHALRVRNEIEGHLSDRLQEAIWREILHLVNDGVATTGELDDAIIYGPGLRWAIMGTNLTFHLAGGDAGMRHMLEQFGPALKLPWTKLEAPELNDTLIDRMVEGTQAQAHGRTIKELERLRNDCLVEIMQVLERHKVGAGLTLARNAERAKAAGVGAVWQPGGDIPCPLRLHQSTISPHWLDAAGQLSHAALPEMFDGATAALLNFAGAEDTKTWRTVEGHTTLDGDIGAGGTVTVSTRVLAFDDDRLRAFHEALDANTGKRVATAELVARSAASVSDETAKALTAMADAHAAAS